MKISAFFLLSFSLLSVIISAPLYPEWISLSLDIICFLIALHIYSFVIEGEKDQPEDANVMEFNIAVLMYHHDSPLWAYGDNVVPVVGHRMVLKTERGVETYAVKSVFQNPTRNVEVYVEPIE